jgi:hypothetical protein
MISRVAGIAGPISPVPSKYIETRGLRVFLDAGDTRSYPGTGTTWTDLSGNGVNFTLRNSPTYSSTNGGILTFSSASFQYADTTTNLGDLATFTTEAWVKWNGNPAGGTNAVVTNLYDGVSKVNFTLGASAPSSATIRHSFYDGAWRNTNSGHTPTLGVWYHYAGTYDGSTLKLYINGVDSHTRNYSGTPGSGGGIRIARRWDDVDNVTTNFTDAVIPVVRIYNRALSTQEVNKNFNSQRARYGV